MEGDGLPLPAGLIALLHDTGGEWRQWRLKAPVNAYGDKLDADFEMSDVARMTEDTAELPGRFEPYDELEPIDEIKVHGFIPDIKYFSKIELLGTTGSDEPFCLDDRDGLQEPKVIFCQDASWRRAAPNLAAFWTLLESCP